MTDPAPLLAMRGISKSFGATRANHDVDLVLNHGEILGLLGENGAGKTTLMNVLFGIYAADAGGITVNGEAVAIHSSADALAVGIGMVHQHFHLVPRHTVLENLMVGQKGQRGQLNQAAARRRLGEISTQYGLALNADRLVGALTVGEQQRLEIVKALFRGARILVLDEPTSVLTPQETEGLFAAIRAMAADDVGIIFISHKLNEVRAITDRVVVMRGGEMTASVDNTDEVTNQHLAELMCGRALTPPDKRSMDTGRVLLRVVDLRAGGGKARPDALDGLSLEIRAGEILGIAGVSGNGQRELAEVIAGITTPSAGHIEVDGTTVTKPSPRKMQALGVADIPEDRMGAGLLTTLTLSDSMVLPHISSTPYSHFGVLSPAAIRAFVTENIVRFGIRAAGPDIRTGTLSGGNLQKALLARELARDPMVLVAAQPTRGLDIAAKEFVHKQFLNLRNRNRGVLLISEDLEELFEITDRIAVIFEGRIAGVLATEDAEVSRIGLLMAGAREAA